MGLHIPKLLNTTLFSGATAEITFDSSAITFTAGMAQRTGALFATAPIVQGDYDGSGTPDQLLFPRGTQVSVNWYENLDPAQGSIAFVWTPEKDRDASQASDETILTLTGNHLIRYEHDNNRLLAYMGAQTVTVSMSTVGGTSYHIVVRWDLDNTLDGTNYVCVSVDDTHTFGGTSAGSTATPNGNMRIGQDANALAPANAIIEGLTIYRRPLFDGTYGINVGNGDEIASMYNSGSYKDPCEVTGSWDVVFALPGSGTAGQLSTGTGLAWSHPHSSNLITATDGFMLDTAWANWTAEGSPSSGAVLATAEKIFQGGYKYVDGGAGGDEGYYKDITVVAGDDWVVRAIGHSDGTSIPTVVLYDQSNGAEIGRLVGSITSTRAAPDVLILTGEAPAGCTTLRLKLISTANGTCYWHQVELLPNLLTNPSLQGGSGDPYIPTGWTGDNLTAGETVQETTTVHSGTDSLKFDGTVSDNLDAIQQTETLTAGKFYAMGAFGYYSSGGTRLEWYEAADVLKAQTGVTMTPLRFNTAAWVHKTMVGRASGTGATFRFRVITAGVTGYADDLYLIALDDVSMTATPATEANSAENGGIRSDGYDSLTQSVNAGDLTHDQYVIKFNYRPRHSAADALKFGNSNCYVFSMYHNGSNRVRLFWSAASTLRCEMTLGGTTVIGSSQGSITGIDADTDYAVVFTYTKGGNVVVTFNDVEKYNKPVLASADAADLTAFTVRWGQFDTGGYGGDAVYS